MLEHLKILVLLSAAFILPGCGPEAASKSVPVDEPPQLFVGNWEGYMSTNILARFEEETGIQVTVSEFNSMEQLEALLQEENSGFDLFVTDLSLSQQYVSLKYVTPLDQSRMSNLDQLNSPLGRDDRENLISIPYMGGYNVIVYNTNHIARVPSSWHDLMDPAYKGKIGLLAEQWEWIYLGLMLSGHPRETTEAAHLEDAISSFARLAEQVHVFAEFNVLLDAVCAGDIWLCTSYNGDAVFKAEQCAAIDVSFPKEGTQRWMDGIYLAREARHPNNAYRFIDFLLRPEIAAQNGNDTAFIPPVTAAIPLMDASLIDNPVLNPSAELRKKSPLFHLKDHHSMDVLNRLSQIVSRTNSKYPGDLSTEL